MTLCYHFRLKTGNVYFRRSKCVPSFQNKSHLTAYSASICGQPKTLSICHLRDFPKYFAPFFAVSALFFACKRADIALQKHRYCNVKGLILQCKSIAFAERRQKSGSFMAISSLSDRIVLENGQVNPALFKKQSVRKTTVLLTL